MNTMPPDHLSVTGPHNVELEQALLGAVLVNNRALDMVAEFLRPEHFLEGLHARIYEACRTLVGRGEAATPTTLKPHFEADGVLEEIGGVDYLADLSLSAVTVVNAGAYGRQIVDLATRRELMRIGQRIANAAISDGLEVTAKEQIEAAEREIYSLTENEVGTGAIQPFDAVTKEAMRAAQDARERGGGILGLSTGFADLDNALGGLAPSDLLVLGARPSMGKSALATCIAVSAARAGNAVGVFSLEMSAGQLASRIVAGQAKLSPHDLSRGKTDDEQWSTATTSAQQVRQLPLFIDETPGLSIDQIRTRARRMRRKHGVELIVVDHMQLVRAKAENRTQEITKISGILKTIARELGVPVIALCQLNRALENRDDKRPVMADLRESGSIEQDGDIVMFLYRAAYYHERDKPKKKSGETKEAFVERLTGWEADLREIRTDADLIISKNRHGPLANVRLHFAPEYAHFSNRAREYEAA